MPPSDNKSSVQILSFIKQNLVLISKSGDVGMKCETGVAVKFPSGLELAFLCHFEKE